MSLIQAVACSNKNNPTGEIILSAQNVAPKVPNAYKILVDGCSNGDFVQVSFSGNLGDVILLVQVVSENTVQVKFFNPTTKSIDINIGTLRVLVTKKQEV